MLCHNTTLDLQGRRHGVLPRGAAGHGRAEHLYFILYNLYFIIYTLHFVIHTLLYIAYTLYYTILSCTIL